MKGINIFLADGFEDIEALGTSDVLRRAGLHTRFIAIGEDPFVVSSHGVTVGIDEFLPEMEISHEGTTARDVMIFPGGMPGSRSLASCKGLIKLMCEHYAAGGTVAAICAAPGLVLSQLQDDFSGVEFTCFDGFEQNLTAKGATFTPKAAVTCGRIITGRSAGHALSFGLEILEKLAPSKVEEVRHSLYLVTE